MQNLMIVKYSYKWINGKIVTTILMNDNLFYNLSPTLILYWSTRVYAIN